MNKDNLIGQKFGRLMVIEKLPSSKNGHAKWLCKCDCGNTKEVFATNLKRGLTTSCGCFQKERTSAAKTIDLTGQRFGKLVVLERVSQRGVSHMTWKCKCDCGRVIVVQGTALKQGITKSCGCTRSRGEEKIKQVLDSLNINYQQEYKFEDLPLLRFDFAIMQYEKVAYLIEFDGKQHFEYTGNWGQTEKEFLDAQKRDQRKNQYCKDNHIPLLRIPYYDLDKINALYILEGLERMKKDA